jgi:hypothetical protein
MAIGRRPSPTQTAPRGGRSRDYLVGGGRTASHAPYPNLAGRHRGQAAIGATGVTGAGGAPSTAFFIDRGFSRRRTGAGVTAAAAAAPRPAWLLHRAAAARALLHAARGAGPLRAPRWR